jgi:hypothetical protein
MASDKNKKSISRRKFLREGATLGLGATALAGIPASAQGAPKLPRKWDREADVVVVGAGPAGLCAAIMACDQGASVIVVEQNHDIGGHGMLSGGRIPLGGGTSLQKKFGVTDSAEQVYLDHTDPKNFEFRYSDRDLVRVWAEENAPTFEFLLENGVRFVEVPPVVVNGGTVPRMFRSQVYSQDLKETINGSPGSGAVRPLEKSARAKGVQILLSHSMTSLFRRTPVSGKVEGIGTSFKGKPVHIRARKGVILATGGHSSNVELRRIFDPRLTAEYQVAGEPWSRQTGDGETQAMALGAVLWATGNQTSELRNTVCKTRHIGCRYGYVNLKWRPQSPMFPLAKASGLTVKSFQNVVLVNQVGTRFWNEMDETFAFLHACLSRNGTLRKEGETENGGGPIWAIFDADAVTRERWEPKPPNVDPEGYFFFADTIAELAAKIANPHQKHPMPAEALQQTVTRYNSFVDSGKDADFNKPAPAYKIQKPPFYAAWSTPIVHDTTTGLKINRKCQVIDLHGQPIPGLYGAGECAGGFGLHGLARVMVFGRIAGREAAKSHA